MAPLREPAQRIFCDDDRPIDDQPEVECSKTHQVRADAGLDHSGECHQHGEWDDQRRYDRRAKIAEQQKQDRNDEQGAFGEVLGDRLYCGVHQLRAVQDRRHSDAGRQGRLNTLHFGFDGGSDRATVPADQHQRCANDHFLAICAPAAGAQVSADRNEADVPYSNRHAATR